MRSTAALLVLAILVGSGFPAGAGDSPASNADANWLEGAWHLPPQKVVYKGKSVDAVPGFIVHLFPRRLEGAVGQIAFAVDDMEGKYLDLFARLRCEFAPSAKKGERLLRLKESVGGAGREYTVKYEIKGKRLQLNFDGPVTLGAGDSAIKVDLSGLYRRYPRLVVEQDDREGKRLDKRPEFFKQLVGKLGLSPRGPSTHHASAGDENVPGGRYLTATLLSADKDKYVVSFSALDYWSQRKAAGGIESFTSSAAGRIEISVGKELRSFGFKFHVED